MNLFFQLSKFCVQNDLTVSWVRIFLWFFFRFSRRRCFVKQAERCWETRIFRVTKIVGWSITIRPPKRPTLLGNSWICGKEKGRKKSAELSLGKIFRPWIGFGKKMLYFAVQNSVDVSLLDGKVGRRPTFLHATQISPKLTHWFASSSSSCTVNEFR